MVLPQVIYTVATWTWRKGVFMIELYNEPELEGCWDVPRFMEQTIIRYDSSSLVLLSQPLSPFDFTMLCKSL